VRDDAGGAASRRAEISRRDLIGSGATAAAMGVGLALGGCGDAAKSQAPRAPHGPTPALRQIAPFPVGTAVSTLDIAEPQLAALIARQFSQVTPNWQMKMEIVLRDDGRFDFTKADEIAAFARANRQRLFGHNLIWHLENPIAFQRLDGGGRDAFLNAYRNYITALVSRYRGQAVGWDVLNEPVAEDGDGLRQSLWSRNLGAEDYMLLAFQFARAADPDAVLLVNEYNLERNPKKLDTFLRLVERLLHRGAPITGLGNQSHVDIDTPPGASARAMRALAGLGLPIHVSEVDVSMGRRRLDLRSPAQKQALQTQRMVEVAEAFVALPPAQRFAFTFWGVRDRDSWLQRPPNGDGTDQPLPFDDDLRPKAAFYAVADVFRHA
jgi:endo-1,4-beta-xylanase